jgi:HrpA-like RNA helicase
MEEAKADVLTLTRYSLDGNCLCRLPSFGFRDTIVRTLETTQALVICGATGCGKTTQVPQFILDHWIGKGEGSKCNIVCTQPQQISAIAVAERVATERGESVPSTVGYQVRLDRATSQKV